MAAEIDVYGIGNALLDTEFDVDEAFMREHGIEKGVMTLVDEARLLELRVALKNHEVRKVASGGSCANSLVLVQLLGGQAFLSSILGKDDVGNQYFDEMQAAGLGSNYLHQARSDSGFSGQCLVMVTQDADRTMNSFLGINTSLSSDQLDLDAIAASKYLLIEGYLVTTPSALEAVHVAIKHAKKHGVTVALSLSDPTIVQYFRSQMQGIVDAGVDLVFCNADEAMICTETEDLEAAKSGLADHVKHFAITVGAQGSIVFDGKDYHEISPYPVDCIDTVGAGDMYAGGFLYALSQGYSFDQAGRLASLMSAQVVSQYGPRLSKVQAQELYEQFVATEKDMGV